METERLRASDSRVKEDMSNLGIDGITIIRNMLCDRGMYKLAADMREWNVTAKDLQDYVDSKRQVKRWTKRSTKMQLRQIDRLVASDPDVRRILELSAREHTYFPQMLSSRSEFCLLFWLSAFAFLICAIAHGQLCHPIFGFQWESEEKRGALAKAPKDVKLVSTLLVIAGIEGTGHHMWHDHVFPHLEANAPDKDVVHVSSIDVESMLLKGVTKYPLAFGVNTTIDSTFHHGESALNAMSEALTTLQDTTDKHFATKRRRLYVLDICSFPCGPDRTPGHDPDLPMLARAASLATPPLRFRVLLGWRDLKEAVASTTYNRRCCFVGDTLAVPYQANVMRNSLMHLNNQLFALLSSHDCMRAVDRDDHVRADDVQVDWAVLDYNAFVDSAPHRSRYVRSIGLWLNLTASLTNTLLDVSNAGVIKPKTNHAGRFTTRERAYLADIFESKSARRLWPTIEKARAACDLLSLGAGSDWPGAS